MILDFKEYLSFFNNDKIIFAPNSSGKTLFAESMVKFETKGEIVLINKKNLLNHFKPTTINDSIFQPLKKAKDSQNNWDLSLSSKRRGPFLNKGDLIYLQDFFKAYKILFPKNETPINEFWIKKSHKKIIFSKDFLSINEIQTKLELSSSQCELLIVSVLILSFKNTTAKIILDDPIEMASWENEIKFREFLRHVSKKTTISFYILTHRITLFKNLISLNKVLSKKNVRPSYIYFMDDIPYWINDMSTSFLTKGIFKKLISENKIFERIVRESLRNNYQVLSTQKSSLEHKADHKNDEEINKLGKHKKDFLFYNQKGYIDNMNLLYSSDNIGDAINSKILFLSFIRNKIINIYNNSNNEKVEKLNKLKVEKMSKIIKKNFSNSEFIFLKRILNQSQHFEENWEIFNEVSLETIFNLLDNFKFNNKIFNKTVKEYKVIHTNKKNNIIDKNYFPKSFIKNIEEIAFNTPYIKIVPICESCKKTPTLFIKIDIPNKRKREVLICGCLEDGIIMDQEGGVELTIESLQECII